MLRKTAVLALALCFALQGAAQEGVYINGSDTLHYSYTPLPEQPQPQKRLSFPRRVVKYFEGSTRDRTFEKKIDFTFAGGPSYSKNTSLGIGLLAAGLYRIDRTDSVTSPSDISIFANVSISGFYALGVTGNNIFSRNGKRIDYTVMFASAPRDMWGIGYNDGRYNEEMTSNIGSSYLLEGIDEKGDIRPECEKQVMGDLRAHFRPEFLNRLDEIITFDQLSLDAITKIVDIELKGLYERIEAIGYKMVVDDEAKRFLAAKGYDVQFGARPLKRAIQNYLEDGLSELIVSAGLQPGDTVNVSVDKEKDELSITKA